MENYTDVIGNWVLSENITEIKGNEASDEFLLSKVNKEIALKANEIESKSLSENEEKVEIDLHSLPLYIPEALNVNKISASLNHTYMTQRWVGHVIDIKDKKFKARLEDLTQPGTYEIGVFDIEDTFDEKEMIKLGAIFYFSVGYDVSRGQYSKQRLIRFQRLSEWTVVDFDNAIDRAARIDSNLKWE
jgi:hypothetical protein